MTSEAQNAPVSTPSGPSAGLEGQGATQETQDATEAVVIPLERIDRFAQACGDPGSITPRRNESVTRWAARAAIAVADQERAELREQRAEWLRTARDWSDRCHAAVAAVAEKDATIAELRAEVERLRKPTVAAVMGYELGAGDLERAEARVAELEATVAKVRDLADEWAAEPVPDDVDDYDSSAVNSYAQAETTVWCGQTLRAILDAPKDSGAAS